MIVEKEWLFPGLVHNLGIQKLLAGLIELKFVTKVGKPRRTFFSKIQAVRANESERVSWASQLSYKL